MLLEPNLFPGKEHFPCMDIHPHVKGGPHLCQGLAHLQNPGGVLPEIHGWVLKKEIKDIFIWQDHTLSTSSWPHLCKSKKFRGLGTHIGYQKSFYIFFFIFWLYHSACRILSPAPGIIPMFPAVEARSPNHWTRKFPATRSLGEKPTTRKRVHLYIKQRLWDF